MQGRRRAARFSLFNAEGVLTVLRDVVIHTTERGTLVAIDVEPRQPGEVLTIESMAGSNLVTIGVEVITCRPIIRSGQVLHEIVMTPVEARR